MAQTFLSVMKSLSKGPPPLLQPNDVCTRVRNAEGGHNECTWEDCAICAIRTYLEVLEVAPEKATIRGSIMRDSLLLERPGRF